MTQRNSVALSLSERKGASMYTASEIAKKAGTTVRTIQYYDKIGLFQAAGRTGKGYRLYDDDSLPILKEILLYRKLCFSLKDIREIMNEKETVKKEIIRVHIEKLTRSREELDRKIAVTAVLEQYGIEKAYETLTAMEEKT